MKTFRVLVADDHALVRAGFRSLLQGIPGVEIVAEAGDGREALRLIEAHQPNLVLMDIAMPGLNGLEAAARVADQFPYVRVIILSMHANEEYVLQALQAGAAGYLLKDANTAELELAVSAVARGETYLCPQVSKQVIADYLQRLDQAGEIGLETGPNARLTPRQREVLQLIAEGHTTQQIARILGVSVKTAETHRAQLMDRLDIHDIAGLVRYAIRMGLVSPDR
jgi:DNA-binding NarL/FixJ family response regulator